MYCSLIGWMDGGGLWMVLNRLTGFNIGHLFKEPNQPNQPTKANQPTHRLKSTQTTKSSYTTNSSESDQEYTLTLTLTLTHTHTITAYNQDFINHHIKKTTLSISLKNSLTYIYIYLNLNLIQIPTTFFLIYHGLWWIKRRCRS